MASIQGELPQGLAAVYERFGDTVDLRVFDRRGGLGTVEERRGWQHRSILESEGTYEEISTRLTAALARHEAQGVFGVDAIRQARGLAPLARDRELSAPDGREPTYPRSRAAEGPQPAVANADGSQEAGKAESAQARGIEADQARLQSQAAAATPGERYQAALRTYLQANAQRLERIEERLETLIENQQATLGELEAQRPGFFASAGTKTGWAADLEASRDRLQTLQGRLARVEELREQTDELAEERMRGREPELAAARDADRREQRNAQVARQFEQQITRQRGRSREQSRELEL